MELYQLDNNDPERLYCDLRKPTHAKCRHMVCTSRLQYRHVVELDGWRAHPADACENTRGREGSSCAVSPQSRDDL